MNYKKYQKGQIIFDNDQGHREVVWQVNDLVAVIECSNTATVIMYRIEYMDLAVCLGHTNLTAFNLDEVFEKLGKVIAQIIKDRKTPVRVYESGYNLFSHEIKGYHYYSRNDLLEIIHNGGEVVNAATFAVITEDDLKALQ